MQFAELSQYPLNTTARWFVSFVEILRVPPANLDQSAFR
jgi:hypothetical protein